MFLHHIVPIKNVPIYFGDGRVLVFNNLIIFLNISYSCTIKRNKGVCTCILFFDYYYYYTGDWKQQKT